MKRVHNQGIKYTNISDGPHRSRPREEDPRFSRLVHEFYCQFIFTTLENRVFTLLRLVNQFLFFFSNFTRCRESRSVSRKFFYGFWTQNKNNKVQHFIIYSILRIRGRNAGSASLDLLLSKTHAGVCSLVFCFFVLLNTLGKWLLERVLAKLISPPKSARYNSMYHHLTSPQNKNICFYQHASKTRMDDATPYHF